jgi:hypothetical protein
LALFLAGCSTQILEADSPGPAVHDCREPTDIFENFHVQIKNAGWSQAKGAKSVTLNVNLEFSNRRPLPHALSNSGDGYVFAVEATLLSGNGEAIKPQTTTGSLSAAGIHQSILPGIPSPAVLTFDVPHEGTTLVITRKPIGGAAPGDSRDRTLACKISG